MKELKKKPDAQEMLIVHKSPAKADPDKAGREKGEAPGVRASAEEFELMRKRLTQAKGAAEKRQILTEIQRRFGNDKAGQLVQQVRQAEQDEMPPPAKKGGK